MTIESTPDDFDFAFDEVAGKEELLIENAIEEAAEEAIEEAIPDDEQKVVEAVEAPANIWDNANDNQRTAYDNLVAENTRLSHQRNSDAGRVGALQRKLNELQAKPSGGDMPTAKDVAKAMQSPEDMETFKSEYPDMADAIESRIAMADVENRKIIQQKIDDAVKPFREDKARNDQASALSYANEQDAAVESAHEGWKDIVASVEFSEWLNHQPAATKELIHSEAAEDAAALVGYFKASQPQEGNSETNTNGDTSVTEIQRKRQKQLNDAAGIPSKSTRSDLGRYAPDDFDGAFDMYAET